MKLVQQYEKEVTTFITVCHRLARNKYVTGYGGNLAWRLQENVILITPTQMYKGDVELDDVVFINPAGETIEGQRKPTGERPMYLKFFKERPDVVSIIHCHAPYAGAIAILKGKNWLERPLYPETTTEIGPVPIVPYGEPLTEQLAENFGPYLRKYNNFIMQNHGLVSMSRGDILWTLHNAELLEETAHSLFIALQSGGEIHELDREAVNSLSNVMTTRDLPLFGLPGANKSLVEMYYPA